MGFTAGSPISKTLSHAAMPSSSVITCAAWSFSRITAVGGGTGSSLQTGRAWRRGTVQQSARCGAPVPRLIRAVRQPRPAAVISQVSQRPAGIPARTG